MDIFHEVMEEVSRRTDLINGKVIAEAFRKASIVCPSCKYPQNAGLFEELLWKYIHLKVEIHRRGKRLRHYDHYGFVSAVVKSNKAGNYLQNLLVKGVCVHAELKKIWPCESCIKIFNPTARYNHITKNLPTQKGVLDYG